VIITAKLGGKRSVSSNIRVIIWAVDNCYMLCLWNSLPYDLRFTDSSLEMFENKRKVFLFDADEH